MKLTKKLLFLSVGILCLAIVTLSQDDALPLPPTCYASTDWVGFCAIDTKPPARFIATASDVAF